MKYEVQNLNFLKRLIDEEVAKLESDHDKWSQMGSKNINEKIKLTQIKDYLENAQKFMSQIK